MCICVPVCLSAQTMCCAWLIAPAYYSSIKSSKNYAHLWGCCCNVIAWWKSLQTTATILAAEKATPPTPPPAKSATLVAYMARRVADQLTIRDYTSTLALRQRHCALTKRSNHPTPSIPYHTNLFSCIYITNFRFQLVQTLIFCDAHCTFPPIAFWSHVTRMRFSTCFDSIRAGCSNPQGLMRAGAAAGIPSQSM